MNKRKPLLLFVALPLLLVIASSYFENIDAEKRFRIISWNPGNGVVGAIAGFGSCCITANVAQTG